MFWPFVRRPRDPEPPMPKWDSKYAALSDFNGERARAAGHRYRVTASPAERAAEQAAAQERIDALSPEYIARMASLQAEYNAMMEVYTNERNAWVGRQNRRNTRLGVDE